MKENFWMPYEEREFIIVFRGGAFRLLDSDEDYEEILCGSYEKCFAEVQEYLRAGMENAF